MKAGMENLTVCCLRYLHRHPYELQHMPASAVIDLLSFGELESEEMEGLLR